MNGRLVERIGEQKPQIEKQQADIKRLVTTEASQQKAFDDFLAGFTAE